MSQDVLITVMNSMSLNNDFVNVNMQKCELCKKCLNLDVELSKSKQAYNDLLKNHSQLEKHCISLEVSMQLKQEVFQNDESCVNQNAVAIQEYFKFNDLKARLQDKDTTISKLKDTIKSLTKNTKEKNVNHDKCDLEPINEELENIKQVKAKQPLDGDLDLACKYATRIQELLVYVQDTCPNAIKPSTKKVAIKPMNNVKKVRFAEPLTSSSNIKQVESSNTSDSNTPVLSSTGVKCSTSNCGSKPPGNKKNDRISQTPSRNKKNKVESQPRKVNKMNRVVKPVCDVDVKQSLSNTNFDIPCATCNKSMFDGVHDKCLLDLVQNRNNRTKSAKKHKKQNIWKPTGNFRFIPLGFVDLDNPSHVYKLNKALYGLKQAPRTWYDMLSSFLISQQFSKGAVDPTLFTRHVGNDILLVQIYVDDIIFASTNTAMCNEFANQMTSKFKMSMMGHMSFFLGLQISQSPGGVFINQSKYASEIVKKYGLHSTDSIDTPMIENKKLDEDLQGKPVDATLYCGIIGSLMYLTSSRPDLNYVVCLCAPG
ncbi:retrovirus-related pol polyprotein from transposon TNT 1-94 [Tanacetum coccineum]